MHRMTFLALAATLAVGCASAPWVHPEKGETGRAADLEACETEADSAFADEEAQALVHGDYDTYGTLTARRAAMVKDCMAARGWKQGPAAVATKEPAPGPSVPAAEAPAAVAGPAPAPQPAVLEATPPQADPGAGSTGEPATQPQRGEIAAPESVEPDRPVETERDLALKACESEADAVLEADEAQALVHGDYTTYDELTARREAIVEDCMIAGGWIEKRKDAPQEAPVPAGTDRAADLAACEAEAEAAYSEAAGDALGHGDFTAYDALEADKQDMLEACMTARGWTGEPED